MNRQKLIFAITLALIIIVCVSISLAYLISTSTTITNLFNAPILTLETKEDFDGITKENVTITSTGNTEMYIRVKFVFSLQDAQGNTLAYPVSASDFEIEGFSDAHWILHNNVYYYKYLVDPHDVITVFDSAHIKTTFPEETIPVFTILVEGIQPSAIQEEWGMALDADKTIEGVKS